MKNSIVKYFDSTTSADTMDALIAHFEQESLPMSDIIELVEVLAFSGEKCSYSNKRVDIASTGGPSSLSTLLCPLYLDTCGLDVVKLGIPGRPAGAVDSLAQIRQYKINYSRDELMLEIDKGGYIHFLANNLFAPADAILYEHRKQRGKVAVPNIAIASLLSKKVAMGLSKVGLDVRVSAHGNFGYNFEQASQNAKLFCKVAEAFDIKAICFVSDASKPYQPYVGRGESLLALYEIIYGTSSSWLNTHRNYCKNMSDSLFKYVFDSQIPQNGNNYDIKSAFERNIIRQSGDITTFIEYCHEIRNGHTFNVLAPSNGYCSYDLEAARQLIVKIQSLETSTQNAFPDPCGIILCVDSGMYVHKGDIVATLRIDEKYYQKYQIDISNIVHISADIIDFETIGNEVIING